MRKRYAFRQLLAISKFGEKIPTKKSKLSYSSIFSVQNVFSISMDYLSQLTIFETFLIPIQQHLCARNRVRSRSCNQLPTFYSRFTLKTNNYRLVFPNDKNCESWSLEGGFTPFSHYFLLVGRQSLREISTQGDFSLHSRICSFFYEFQISFQHICTCVCNRRSLVIYDQQFIWSFNNDLSSTSSEIGLKLPFHSGFGFSWTSTTYNQSSTLRCQP